MKVPATVELPDDRLLDIAANVRDTFGMAQEDLVYRAVAMNIIDLPEGANVVTDEELKQLSATKPGPEPGQRARKRKKS